MSVFEEIQSALRERADLNARLSLVPYEGTPEVKEINGQKYLYTRKRVGSKVTSTYVGVYSDDLYQLLLRNTREARELRKQLRKLNRSLAALGYQEGELSPRVIQNLDFARANMKANIYDQAVLEGVATSFPQTEEIIENGKVNGMAASDVQKILNLKHAWEFILDQDVIQAKSDYYVLCHIARLVNEGFFADGGRIRGVPVTIGGSSYIPPLPMEFEVRERIEEILQMERGTLRVVPQEIDCDMYRLLAGDIQLENAYQGEYMASYSWACMTEGMIESKLEQKRAKRRNAV